MGAGCDCTLRHPLQSIIQNYSFIPNQTAYPLNKNVYFCRPSYDVAIFSQYTVTSGTLIGIQIIEKNLNEYLCPN
jgi:hypothetical protein